MEQGARSLQSQGGTNSSREEIEREKQLKMAKRSETLQLFLLRFLIIAYS